ncbi:MFS transporter [Actinomadura oligospora]|uniref:MFS transporter n=1 Tax=Actinomadura oligospora TaxID=111804 RepID=UPI00047B4DD0|nr:MFS transporter [Actinomadura oligospora]
MTDFRLLTNRAVTPLLVARLLSSAGVGFGQVALVWGLKTNGYSADAISLVAACKAIPALLILAGGVLGDRFKRHHVLAGADLTASLTWLAIGACLLNSHTPTALLCVLALLSGTAYFIFLPTVRGIVADLLPGEQRHAGNALVWQAEATGALIGLAAGGVAVSSFGASSASVLKAAMCLVSAALLLRLDIPRRRTKTPGLISELAAGWRHFAGHPWMWAIALQFTTAVMATATLTEIIGPLFMTDHGRTATTWGIVGACEAFGALAGAVLAVWWKPRQSILLTVVLLTFAGAPVLAVGVAASSEAIAVTMLVSGVAKAVCLVLWLTQLQKTLPLETLARVNAWSILPAYALAPIALLLVGPLTQANGPEYAALLVTAIVLISTAAALLVLLLGVRVKSRKEEERDEALTAS